VKLSKDDLGWAASQGVITPEQAEKLWTALETREAAGPGARFDLAHVAYYFGALIVISAMGYFLGQAWDAYGGQGIFGLAVTYAFVFILAGRTLYFRRKLRTPGGLLFTMAVCMTPIAVYGLLQSAGWSGHLYRYDYDPFWGGSDDGRILLMELGTVIAGLVALWFVRFPFLTAPIALALWGMAMNTAHLLGYDSWNEELWVSVIAGLVMLLGSYLVDRRTKEDYAFWGYLFGLMAFWGGMSMMYSDSDWRKAVYCAINVGLMVASVLLQRRVFVVFGALGVFGYVCYLAHDLFGNSLIFPCALTVIGIFVIYLGVKYHQGKDKLERLILERVPEVLKELLLGARGKK
jgi:hypothetical protein